MHMRNIFALFKSPQMVKVDRAHVVHGLFRIVHGVKAVRLRFTGLIHVNEFAVWMTPNAFKCGGYDDALASRFVN